MRESGIILLRIMASQSDASDVGLVEDGLELPKLRGRLGDGKIIMINDVIAGKQEAGQGEYKDGIMASKCKAKRMNE